MGEFVSLSVVMPAISETYLLEQTVGIVIETCDKKDLAEIIIVLCEKSEPECVKTAERLAAESNDVPVWIYYQKKPFIAAAYGEAIAFAKGSHYVTVAGDRESAPEDVSVMIEQSKLHPDAIITASRWIKGGGFDGYSKVKYVCNFIFNRWLALLFHSKLSDMTHGYRLFPTELLRSIRWEEALHPFFLEMCLKPLRLGVEFVEIPSVWKVRSEGRSQNTFFRNFRYFKTAFHVRFMKKEDITKNPQYQNITQ